MKEKNPIAKPAAKDYSWQGSWNRPMKVNPEGLHPLTVARMTDHNVRGPDFADAPTDTPMDSSDDDMVINSDSPMDKAA